jgi:(S)-ureidoglycine aminohydrolase
MNLFGSTRSTFQADHSLIAPDSFVQAPLPGWEHTQGVILISPQRGARFTQYLALMEADAVAGPPLPGIERVIYVVEGEVALTLPPRNAIDATHTVYRLGTGGYAFIPADTEATLGARATTQLNVFEKRYVPLAGVVPPALLAGQEQDVAGVPFLGNSDAVLQTFLPTEPSFDLAVNLFTYRPGATLPMVEVHVMEHGLLMLQGQGVYRLGDAWYPVRQGDVIWMAPYCPQWFVAMGKEPARYLYYKDVNRDPFQG